MDFLTNLMHRFDFIHRLDHDRWWVWPVGGITLDTVKGLMANIDGATVVNAVNAGWIGFLSGCFGLWRLWFVIQNRNSEDARRTELKLQQEQEEIKIRLDEERRASFNRVPEIIVVHSAETQPITPPVVQQAKDQK